MHAVQRSRVQNGKPTVPKCRVHSMLYCTSFVRGLIRKAFEVWYQVGEFVLKSSLNLAYLTSLLQLNSSAFDSVHSMFNLALLAAFSWVPACFSRLLCRLVRHWRLSNCLSRSRRCTSLLWDFRETVELEQPSIVRRRRPHCDIHSAQYVSRSKG